MSCSSADEMFAVADTMRYPRTGKRGVPQQFPRRLYEMLESENQCAPQSSDSPSSHDKIDTPIVHWSNSGRAFRIVDVQIFSNTVLPKFFKTSKFSSFQRNLNLYGFTKVRRGPDVDMYFHPKFIRGDANGLSQLRKRASSSPIKKKKKPSSSLQHKDCLVRIPTNFISSSIRTVSPTVHSSNHSNYHHANASAKINIHNLHNSSIVAPNSMPYTRISSEESSLVSAASSDNESVTMPPSPINATKMREDNISVQATISSPINDHNSRRLAILAEAMRMVI